MKSIKTVDELIKFLKRKDNDTSYLEIMQSIDIPIREFEKYYSWKKTGITRNRLIKTNDFELLLICFEKDHHSPVNAFDSTQLWIQTVQGELFEERFKIPKDGCELKQLSSSILKANEYSFIPQLEIHRFSNVNEGRSVSLNLYSKPVVSWNQYEMNGNSKTVTAKYDSIYV